MRAIFILAMLAAGCSATPRPTETAAEQEARRNEVNAAADAYRAKAAAEAADWRVECSNDHHGTAERRCSVRNDNGFIVSFVDGQGPYMQVGFSSHIDKPNVVRVDDGRVHVVNRSRGMLPAGAVVRDLLRGKMAYATWYDWPYDTPRHTETSLEGFKEAYARLLEMKSVRKPKPVPAHYTE